MNEQMSSTASENCACDRLVKNFKDGFGEVRKAVGGLANQTRADVVDAGGEVYSQLKEVSQCKTKSMEERIRKEPLRSMALCAGAGLVLGLYIKR